MYQLYAITRQLMVISWADSKNALSASQAILRKLKNKVCNSVKNLPGGPQRQQSTPIINSLSVNAIGNLVFAI